MVKMKTSKEEVFEKRPGVRGRGGTKTKGPRDPCLFTFKEKLEVRSEEVFEGLRDGMKLAVIRQGDKILIVDKGMIVGTVSKKVRRMLNCMEKNYSYEATVISKERGSRDRLLVEVLIEGIKRG